MALTPEQIQQFRQKYNIGTGADTAGVDGDVSTERISNLRKRLLERQGVETLPSGQLIGPQTMATEKDLEASRPGFFSRIGADLKERGQNIKETFGKTFRGEITPLEVILPTIGDVAGGVTDVLTESFVSGLKALTPDIAEDAIANKAKEVLDTKGGKAALNALQNGLDAWDSFKLENPRIAEQVEGVVNIAEVIPAIKGTQFAAKGTFKLSKSALRKTVNKIDDFKNFRNAKYVRSVEDKIAPGINSKQMRQIIKEGRVESGPQSRLFGAKKDIITQTDEVKRAAATVNRRIPNAEKLDDFQLVNASNKEIESIAKGLESKLKQIRILPRQKTQIDEAWGNLKRTHQADPELSTVPGFNKLQSNFETFIDDLKTPVRNADGTFRERNLNDIWEIRKKYDNSVKDNIKTAGANSPSDLQFKKEIWLDNRRILNDLIDDMSKRLGGNSRRSFNDMSDLYRVVNNVSSKAKIKLEDAPGVLSPQNIKKLIIRYGVPAALGYTILTD